MISLNSVDGITRPEGLLGEFRMINFVFGVIARRTMSAVSTNLFCSVSIKTDLPRANVTISGNETQYGLGIRTSSLGLMSETTALKIACLQPDVAMTSFRSYIAPKSVLYL